MGASGPDATITAPPLTSPPLSLVSSGRFLYPYVPWGSEQDDGGPVGEGPPVDNGPRRPTPDALEVIQQAVAGEEDVADLGPSPWASLSDERWVNGFQFLPEPGKAAAGTWAPCSGTTVGPSTTFDTSDTNRPAAAIYYPFFVFARDDRSTLGFHTDDYEGRALRGLNAHEIWQVEREFYLGTLMPFNPHLSASHLTAGADPEGRAAAFADPSAPYTTTMSTAVGYTQALPALDQAIADADCGVGMIHATPFLVQKWFSNFQVRRQKDPDGHYRIYTVNGNVVVPGYGYPTGTATKPDGFANPAANTEYAYATDMVYLLRGDVVLAPGRGRFDQMSPQITANNEIAFRAMRPWACVTNQQCRAAVLVNVLIA